MKERPSFEQIWDELPSHLPAPDMPVGMEDRFWARFEQELGPEEEARQQRARRRSFWSSLFAFRWYGLAGGAVAAALLVTVWVGPQLIAPAPKTLAHKKTKEQPNVAPTKNPSKVAMQVQPSAPTASPEPDSEVAKDLSLYQNMEVLEKMQLLEKLPSLTKGS